MIQTNGFYKSSLIVTKEWHAGAEIIEESVNYLKFFSGRRWLITYHYPAYDSEFNFIEFLNNLSIDAIFGSKEDPPINPNSDYQMLYQLGTYQLNGNNLDLKFFSNIANMYISIKFRISDNFNILNDLQGNLYTYNDH